MTTVPNALIVGAGKAGSTSLHNYLDGHPEVSGSKTKELMYFTSNFGKGEDWYLSNFDTQNGAKVFFESTPQYSFRDEYPLVAKRVHDYNPDMRILYVVREPLARIVSHFNHWASIYPERYTNITATLEDPEQRKFFIERTRYFYQISAYLEVFPNSQVKVVFLEDLEQIFSKTLNEIFSFLDVTPTTEKIETKVWNKRNNPKWEVSDISPKCLREVQNYLKDDVQALLSMCGKPGSYWGAVYL